MTPHKQASLGFSQMRAAIIGGHDLMAAWAELADMIHVGKMPNVIVGGLGCLLYCTEAISRAGRLPVVPDDDLNGFLQAAYHVRIQACMAALKAGDVPALGRMVSVMLTVIDMNRTRITFIGSMPSVAPTGNSLG